ncbi:MAG: hypothetical protein WC773_00535 [Patescibacteria group bacterium]
MTKQQKNIIMIAILVVLSAFALIQLWIGPLLQTNLTQLNQLNADVNAKTARLNTINKIKAPLADLESAMSDIDKVGLPKGNSLPDLIEQVENIVAGTKDAASNQPYFSVTSFVPNLTNAVNSAGASASANSLDFTLAVRGNPDNLAILLDAFNKNVRPMSVKSMTLAPDSTSSDVLVTLTMTAYNGAASSTKSSTASQ